MGWLRRNRTPQKSDTLLYNNREWDTVMFVQWPELRALPYWQRYRDLTSRFDGRAYVTEYYDIERLLESSSPAVPPHAPKPEPYHFTVVMSDGRAPSQLDDVGLSQLMSGAYGLPAHASLLRHIPGRWPLFYVDILRDAGRLLSERRDQLRNIQPQRSR